MADEFDVFKQLQEIEKAQEAIGAQVGVGDFELETAWINYGKDGYEYPIADKILNIYVHEDMEAFGITGWLDILDTANLVRNGPIVGQELLYMKFATSGSEAITDYGRKRTASGLSSQSSAAERFTVDFTKHPLWIYTIEDMSEMKSSTGAKLTQALTYRLYFCSPEVMRNDRIKISQTMEGSYSDIIKKVLKNHLKTTKNVEVLDTTDLKHFVIPNMHPFDVINWATNDAEMQHQQQAVPDYKHGTKSPNPFRGRAADFYFYETTRGYKFLPAMSSPETTVTLTLGNAPDVERYQNQMTTSLEYEYSTLANTRNSIPTGLWGSKYISHDHYNKSVKTYQSNYHRSIEREEYSYISKTPAYLPTNIGEKNRENQDKNLSDFPDSLLMLGSFSGKKNSSVKKNSDQINYPWSITPADLDMRRRMQTLHGCNYNMLRARFPGISSLQVGMVVQLRLPDIGTASGQYDDEAVFVNRLNNWWIIKQLTHVINNKANERYYHCDVLLSNTMREIGEHSQKLPTYTGMGSNKQFTNTPTDPTFE